MNIFLFIAGIALCLPMVFFLVKEDIVEHDFGDIILPLICRSTLAFIGIIIMIVAVVRHFN